MNSRNDRTTPDPTIQRELDALDAALCGQSVDGELADLGELATQLRELREIPSEEFAATLDTRAASGFPGRRRGWSQLTWGPARDATGRLADRVRGASPRRKLLPALAGATTVIVIATAVVVSSGRDGGSDAVTSIRAQEGGAPPAEAPRSDSAERRALSTGEVAPSTLTVPQPPGPGTAPGVRNRRVERSAELTLATSAEDLRDVTAKAFDVIGRHRGIVLRSSIDEGEEGEANASFELLIPSGRISPALADLSALAEVRSRSENTLDITAPFVSAQERLRDARAEAEGLLRQLAEADTDAERASVKAQLGIVRGRIAAFRSQVNRLQRRSSFSRVSLAVVTGDQVSVFPGADDGAWGIGDALDDAGRVLAVAAGIALVSLAVALPLVLLGVGAWIARRRYLRRAREHALGT